VNLRGSLNRDHHHGWFSYAGQGGVYPHLLPNPIHAHARTQMNINMTMDVINRMSMIQPPLDLPIYPPHKKNTTPQRNPIRANSPCPIRKQARCLTWPAKSHTGEMAKESK